MTDPIDSEPGETEAIPDPVATRGIPHTTHDSRFWVASPERQA